MTTKIHQIGNSLGLYIPKALAQKTGLKRGTAVSLRPIGSRMIIEPVAKKGSKKYTLAQLLKGVTRRNLHSLVEWGPATGREIW